MDELVKICLAHEEGLEDGLLDVYLEAKKEFKALYGSCLDAPNYQIHWDSRENYACKKVQDYIKLHR